MTYLEIGGGYKFALDSIGATLVNPEGRSVYFQFGDEIEEILETVNALENVPADKLAAIAEALLGDYFA